MEELKSFTFESTSFEKRPAQSEFAIFISFLSVGFLLVYVIIPFYSDYFKGNGNFSLFSFCALSCTVVCRGRVSVKSKIVYTLCKHMVYTIYVSELF